MAKPKKNQTETPKLNLVPVEKEARKWGTDPRNVINWIKIGKISGSRLGESWGVDKGSITRYMQLNAKISQYDKILEKKLQEKEKALRKFNNNIFIINNLYELTPAFQLVLYEMSTLIPTSKDQVIFLDMFLGKKEVETIAEEHHLPPEQIIFIQRKNIKIICAKSKFLKNYRNILKELKSNLRRLEIQNRTKKEVIQNLQQLLPSEVKESLSPYIECVLTPEIVTLLSTPLKDILTDKRSLNCLLCMEIETVEELIRFLKKSGGYNSFLRVRNFGYKTLQKLRLELYRKNIVYLDGTSHLFKYI